MATWLVKTEPGTYAWSDLAAEGTTAWTGVANPQAQASLRAMRKGDRVLVYHSGVKEAVGVAAVAREAYPDPEADGPGLVCVDLAAEAPLAAPVSLEALKAEKVFAGSALVRQGRLSVVPLSAAEWKVVERLAGRAAGTSGTRPGKPAQRSRGR
jgi:predicted RNA-binding protein with PUA-like domain